MVDATQLSQEDFRRDFWMLGKPVILKNATNNWCVHIANFVVVVLVLVATAGYIALFI